MLSQSSQVTRTDVILQFLLGLSNKNVKKIIFKIVIIKKSGSLTSKGLFLYVSSQNGLKTICTDITEGGCLAQITVLGHQLPRLQIQSLVWGFGVF